MARSNNKNINVKNIEKITITPNNRANRPILWKKILKDYEEGVINEKFIDDVFALNTDLEKKFRFFHYLLVDNYMDKETYSLLRDKLCDSSTWNHQRLSNQQASLLVKIFKLVDFNLYPKDKNNIRYIDKIENFLKEDSNFKEKDFTVFGFESLRSVEYEGNIDDYFKELIKLDYEELKETILKIFGDVNYKFEGGKSFLSFCQELSSTEVVLNTSKTFLEIGANPNDSYCSGYYEDNRRRHVLSTSIIKARDTDFICSMIEEFMWHGLNVYEVYPTIFEDLINCGYSYEDNLEVFKVIYINSFNKQDVHELSFSGEDDDICNKLNKVRYGSHEVDLIYKKFKSNGYELDKNYYNIAINIIEEFSLIIEALRGMLSLNKFEICDLIYETVIKSRKEYLNIVDSKINFFEIMDAIKVIKNQIIHEIDDNFNKCNEKILTYKN